MAEDTPSRRHADVQIELLTYRVNSIEAAMREMREELRSNTDFTKQSVDAIKAVNESLAIRKGVRRLLRWIAIVGSAAGAMHVLGVEWKALVEALKQ